MVCVTFTLTLYSDTFSAIFRSFLERRGPSSWDVSPLSFASCRSLKKDRFFFTDLDKARDQKTSGINK